MNRKFQWILALTGIMILPMGVANAADHEFSIVVLPDIQTYTAKRPQILEAQIEWITQNQATENIIYVSQLGDLKDVGRGATGCINGTIAWPGPGSNVSTEWDIVRRAFDQLDTAGIPYGVSPGNHDFDSGDFPANTGGCPNFDDERPLVGYNGEFPPSSFPPEADKYAPRTAFSNEDNYVTASSNGVDFLFINLGYQEEAPAAGSTASIDWAETQLTNFPNHLAIITSHNLVDCNKAPGQPQISGNGPCAITPDYNQLSTYGANIVDRLRGYRNLFMLIGGHRFGEAYLQVDRSATSSGAEGFPPVHAVLANYQHMRYSATQFADVKVDGPPSGSSGYFKLMEFDMDDMSVDMVSLSPALDAQSEITAPNAFPVLSNALRSAVVRSSRNIDANNLADRFDSNGDSTLHDRSVSNLNNISFADYVSFAPPGPEPFERTGSRSNDAFFRFLGGAISESEVTERCSDGDGCRITLTRTYGANTNVDATNFSYNPATSQFQILAENGSVIRTGTNANGGTEEILGPRANTFCWFSDWDTSGNTGNGDQNGNFAVIIWNTTATNLTCSIRIDD